MRKRRTTAPPVPPPRPFVSEEERARAAKAAALAQRQAYKEVGREYATPPPPNALPPPAQATAGDPRDRNPETGYGRRALRNASERYRFATAHWNANGCMYRGKNTADGRCPGCGKRAHPQRGGGKRK